MKHTSASRDYKVGQKNNWRRRVWNEVLSRTAGREQEQPILYLAGPQDIDRAVATDKGVPDRNLIAIDRAQRNVNAIRSEGHSAINADALDLLWTWPEDRPVAAVLLDFCSGIECNNAAILDAFQRAPLQDAVVMVNFQRGRDPWSNGIRDGLEKAGLMVPIWKSVDDQEPEKWHDDTRHRGYQFVMFHAWDSASTIFLGRTPTVNMAEGGVPLRLVVPDNEEWRIRLHTLVSVFLMRMNPVFYTYRSGVLTFDSAVLLAPWNDTSEVKKILRSVGMGHDDDETVSRLTQAYRVPSIARKLAAMFAVRTRRMQA